MKEYKHKRIKAKIKISDLVNTLIREIDDIYFPLFRFIDDKQDLATWDHFNRIRLVMPLLEISSLIEFRGDVHLLLKKLSVPKPEISWAMFRDGLSHTIRSFNVKIDGEKLSWAVPCHKTKNHWLTSDSIGIDAPKLLDDLRAYLNNFIFNEGTVEIQTGLEFIKKPSSD